MGNCFYITTAIDYVNGRPHLGHAYEKVLTDVVARYQRHVGNEVFFLTGSDEYGQKVQMSAEREGRSPQEFCDEMSGHFRSLYEGLNISYDDFIRTTEERHKDVVRGILQKIYDDGDIYESEYEGFYSTRQEQFLTDKDRVDGEFSEHFGEVVSLKEKNYFFKLSKYQDWLREYVESHPEWIFPKFRRKEVLGALENPIPDLCISRPKERLSWGIPLPFDADQVTYVWFDALINYVSALGVSGDEFEEKWPAVHVIGKDIMVPPHAIYWPIMLKAAGIKPPKQLLVHGFWTMNQEKMSKSTGNVVDPRELVEVYGADAFRYYVMREMTVGKDADFSLDSFHQRYSSELGNEVGNLLNRTVSMIKRYRGGEVPQRSEGSRGASDDDLEGKVLGAVRLYRELMDGYQVNQALMELWRGFQRLNQYVDEMAPWKLAKEDSEEQKKRLDYVLSQLANGLGLLLHEVVPVLPESSGKGLVQLGVEGVSLSDGIIWWDRVSGNQVGAAEPLFPRVEREDKSEGN